MIAIIETGGKQYLVSEASRVDVEKLGKTAGDPVAFDKVLLISGPKGVRIGQPYLSGATVQATVEREYRDAKVTVLKYKPKVRYRKKYGHRQTLTRVKIDSIGA